MDNDIIVSLLTRIADTLDEISNTLLVDVEDPTDSEQEDK